MNFTACSLGTIISAAVLLNVHVENTIKIINWKMENSRTWMFQCLLQSHASLFMLSTVVALVKDYDRQVHWVERF